MSSKLAQSTDSQVQSRTIHNVLAGAISGIWQLFFLFPIDTIKTRLQTQAMLVQVGEKQLFKGPIDCAKVTFQKEGIRGFYKGMSSVLAMQPISSSILFASYGKGKELCERYNEYRNRPKELTYPQYLIAGSVSGFVSGVIYCPQELVKVRLQMQVNDATYSGPIDCIRSIIKKNGVRGMFSGLSATMFRDVFGTAAWYGSYEIFRREFGGPDAPVYINMLSGSLAGATYWVVAFPADLVKSRVQWSGGDIMPIYKDIIGRHGFRGLYTGFSTALMRSMPSSGV